MTRQRYIFLDYLEKSAEIINAKRNEAGTKKVEREKKKEKEKKRSEIESNASRYDILKIIRQINSFGEAPRGYTPFR